MVRHCAWACALGFGVWYASGAEAIPEKPTYAGDVTAILFDKCAACHRPGQIAPMSLLTYDEVRPWVKSIEKRVSEGSMPPWHAVPGIGKFANDRSLTPEQKETILRWARNGAPRGDLKDLPPSPKFPESEWTLGEPDLIVEFQEVEVPAGSQDQFHDLPATANIVEDTWVRAIEVDPGNAKVVHHVIIWQRDEGLQGPQGWLGAWAAGMEPMVFPEGTGRLLKKGATLIADMHYHPAETDQTDRTRIGLYFAKENKVEKELVNLWVQNAAFVIPAGHENFEVRSNYTFSQDSFIHAFLPHMHYRGKDFTYTATFPDGRQEVIMKAEKYDFNWQTVYRLAEPLFIPKGTRIDCVAHYDNSANNPANPDPTRDVPVGNQSFDEMMIGFIDFTVKEGLRPLTAAEMIDQILEGLRQQHPGDVYRVILEPGDDHAVTALYLPREGEGAWHVNVMNMLRESRVHNVTFNGQAVAGTVTIGGMGSFKFDGTLDADTGKISGKILIPGQGEMPFEGERIN